MCLLFYMVRLKSSPTAWPWKTHTAETNALEAAGLTSPKAKRLLLWKNGWLLSEARSSNCQELLNSFGAWENEVQMEALQAKSPLCLQYYFFSMLSIGVGFIPLPAPPRHLFFKETVPAFYFSKGLQGAGRGWEREKGVVIPVQGGLVLVGVRDTQLLAQRPPHGALLEPNSIPVCQTTLSRGVRYREPAPNAKASNEGKKVGAGAVGGQGGRGWGMGRAFLLEEKGSCSNLAVSF